MTVEHEAWLARIRAAWDERAPRWDAVAEVDAATPDRAADLARTARALRLGPGVRLLDAGCGTGQFAIAFARLGCAVTAVDLSPAMLARARQHAADRGIAITWREGDLARLPDPNGAFDAVHLRATLHLLPDVAATLGELRRVLRPGGRLYASVPGALSPIYRRSWRRFVAPSEQDMSFILPWELEQLLAELGWTVAAQWGEYGQNVNGVANAAIAANMAALDLRLQQSAATTWTVVAEAADV